MDVGFYAISGANTERGEIILGARSVVVGRQPILDRNGQTVGYELLFRPDRAAASATDGDHGLTGDQMTAHVTAAAIHLGIDRLVGDTLIFCNADRGVILGEVPIPLPPRRTVIELLESVTVDDEVLAGCRSLIDAGYRLALDDFVPFDGDEKLLDLAEIVKLDIVALGVERALTIAETLRPQGVTLLAEKIETQSQLRACYVGGFDLFQGYALAHPVTFYGPAATAPTLSVLELAGAILDEHADFAEVEEIIRRDPVLALQLLQIATVGDLGEWRRPVRTLHDALVLLGTRRLNSWITLLLLTTDIDTVASDRVVTVLVRARMSELLAEQRAPHLAPMAFAAGMVSALDQLLRLPPDTLAAKLELDDQLLEAAFRRSGPVGALVEEVIAHEAGRADGEVLDDTAAAAYGWAVRTSTILMGV